MSGTGVVVCGAVRASERDASARRDRGEVDGASANRALRES